MQGIGMSGGRVIGEKLAFSILLEPGSALSALLYFQFILRILPVEAKRRSRLRGPALTLIGLSGRRRVNPAWIVLVSPVLRGDCPFVCG
jgi:hypothetical protein